MADARARWYALPEWWLLTVLAFATRFWRLSLPSGRVWDEVYFQDFASRYFTGSYYFDVHPPLTKLLFALSARLLHVPTSQLTGGAGITAFRVFPALTGSLLVPLVWWLMRELGGSRRTAAFGATLVLLDTALLAQSRLALTDIPLLWFGIAAVTCYLAARRASGTAHWALLTAAALLGGCAAATKWTGLTALGFIGAVWLFDAWRGRTRRGSAARLASQAIMLVALPAVVYVGAFVVHLRLLPNDGPGTSVMSRTFNETRRGSSAFRDDASMGTLAQIAEIHRVALQTNLGWSTLQHLAASPWYTWPISQHRIMLWKDSLAAPGTEARMDIQGNPLLWYGLLAAAGVFVAMLALGRVRPGGLREPLLLSALGYAMNFLPFALITRPMYLYHYNGALVFSIAFASLALGLLCDWQADDRAPWAAASVRARGWYLATIAAVLVGFVYFAPLAYGTPLSAAGAAQRKWVLERQ